MNYMNRIYIYNDHTYLDSISSMGIIGEGAYTSIVIVIIALNIPMAFCVSLDNGIHC